MVSTLRQRLVGALSVMALCTGCFGATAQWPESGAQGDVDRLRNVFAARASEAAVPSYRLAKGDSIQVTVAGVDEITGDYSIGSDGRMFVPLVGSVAAEGLTVEQLEDSLAMRLAADYLRSPSVSVTVAEYVGRRVSVLGAVAKPGFYPLKGQPETILDVIVRAGGISNSASPKVYFTPARASTSQTQGLLGAGAGGDPIEIDIADLYTGETVPALRVPVRDGDTILVQGGGRVFVTGWVNTEGALAIERGMTITQALGKAGGTHFGGSGRGVLSRVRRDGKRSLYDFRLSGLLNGEQRDIVLEPGDRIHISANPLKASAWGVYSFVTAIVSIGIGGSVRVF